MHWSRLQWGRNWCVKLASEEDPLSHWSWNKLQEIQIGEGNICPCFYPTTVLSNLEQLYLNCQQLYRTETVLQILQQCILYFIFLPMKIHILLFCFAVPLDGAVTENGSGKWRPCCFKVTIWDIYHLLVWCVALSGVIVLAMILLLLSFFYDIVSTLVMTDS